MTRPEVNVEAVEKLIDAYGVKALLNAIAYICIEKGQHVFQTWQDRELCRAWEKVARGTANVAKDVDESLL